MGDQVVVGRDSELVFAADFLDATASGPATFLLEGEAGVGKTVIWTAVLDMADRRGVRVLRCQPSSSETPLSYSALDDLLTGAVDEVVASLPEPQRVALEVVLLRVVDRGSDADVRTVCRAVLETLRRLAG